MVRIVVVVGYEFTASHIKDVFTLVITTEEGVDVQVVLHECHACQLQPDALLPVEREDILRGGAYFSASSDAC